MDEKGNMSTTEENLRKALLRSNQALDDWVRTYAPEFCGDEHVEETRKRITEGGGTLAYIADIREGNKKALGGEKNVEEKKGDSP